MLLLGEDGRGGESRPELDADRIPDVIGRVVPPPTADSGGFCKDVSEKPLLCIDFCEIRVPH